MTKKDYETISYAIKATKLAIEENRTGDKEPLQFLTQVLMNRLKSDNDNFNRQKFVNACGYQLDVMSLEVTK